MSTSSDDKNPLYSSHIFMFPFRFDWNENGFQRNEYAFYKDESVQKRVSLDQLHEKLTTQKQKWNYKPFNVEENYNEYAYFYDYARDAIYNRGAYSKDAISNYYDKDGLKGERFELNIKGKEYTLTIAGVTLRVFSTGVAILSLELENREHHEFSDILRINDFGRRIYPQFVVDGKVEVTKEAFLAQSIKIPALKIEENFERDVYNETFIGRHIMGLLDEDVFTQNEKKEKHYYVQPSIDDRMFVVSWCRNKLLSSTLRSKNSSDYLSNDKWYKYVFVDNDGDANVQNDAMKEKLLKDATYDRWSGYGTFFGFSRYSFVALEEGDFVKSHMSSMYFQMITLLLATRTSILRFSDEIAALASDEQIESEKLTKLYQRYLTFYNRLYFKEVTHQDQGIELYDMALKQMKIVEHIEKLDGKFTKLFEFAKMQSDDKQSESMDKLSLLGAIFLPPSLMVGILSIGIFDYNNTDNANFMVFFAIFASVALGILSIKKMFQNRAMAWLYGVLFAVVVFFSYGNIDSSHHDKPVEVKVID